MNGESLGARLRRDGKLGTDDARRVLADIADALDYAHRRGVSHRDIKPDNILIDDESGRALLADFGIARGTDKGGTVTRVGDVVGTPQYMSPEQARGADLDGRSDLYSLGAVGFAMLSGRAPFVGGTTQEVFLRRLSENAPPLLSVAAGASPELAGIIDRCLAREPSERFADARALRLAVAPTALDSDELPEPLDVLDGRGTSLALFSGFALAVTAGTLNDAIAEMLLHPTRDQSLLEGVINGILLQPGHAWARDDLGAGGAPHAAAFGRGAGRPQAGVPAQGNPLRGLPAAAKLALLLVPAPLPEARRCVAPVARALQAGARFRHPRARRSLRRLSEFRPAHVRRKVRSRDSAARLIRTSRVRESPPERFPELGQAGAGDDDVVVHRRRAQPVPVFRFMRTRGFDQFQLHRASSALLYAPTANRAVWRQSDLAAILAQAADAGPRPPSTPAEYPSALTRIASGLTGEYRNLGDEAARRAHGLVENIAQIDRSLPSLERGADPKEAQRIDARLAGFVADSDDRRELLAVLQKEREIVRRSAQRLAHAQAARARNIDALNALWTAANLLKTAPEKAVSQIQHALRSSEERPVAVPAVDVDAPTRNQTIG